MTQKRVTNASGPGGNSMQCTYDGLGRCLKRTINGVTTLFTYDGWRALVEWDTGGNYLYGNVYGPGVDEILFRYDMANGRSRLYQGDIHGNVSFITDAGGNVIEKYTYDAFGKPTITDANGTVLASSACANRFMFQGREWIGELGIYDYRNRAYQPEIGRFLQADPLGFGGGDANLFRYCGGDPVNGSDPMGTDVQAFAQGPHVIWGVGNPTQGWNYYDFYPSVHNWHIFVDGVRGVWSTATPPDPSQVPIENFSTTASQDAAVKAAFDTAVATPGSHWYNFWTHNCFSEGLRIVESVLLRDPTSIAYISISSNGTTVGQTGPLKQGTAKGYAAGIAHGGWNPNAAGAAWYQSYGKNDSGWGLDAQGPPPDGSNYGAPSPPGGQDDGSAALETDLASRTWR